jgi:signal recognition particle receptor subunit beta
MKFMKLKFLILFLIFSTNFSLFSKYSPSEIQINYSDDEFEEEENSEEEQENEEIEENA